MNKKGWLKIVEAFLAVLIVLTAAIIVMSKQTQKTDMAENVYKKQRDVLSIVVRNDSLREKIILNDNYAVDEVISKFIPTNWGFATRICNITDICNTDTPNDRDVYATEVLVTSTLREYSPKKLKFFVWIK